MLLKLETCCALLYIDRAAQQRRSAQQKARKVSCTKHEEGQRGTFQDKVWTADKAKEHVSERKFVDDAAAEENVLPEQDKDMTNEEEAAIQ